MKNLVLALGFKPKENISDVFIKKYAENYSIEKISKSLAQNSKPNKK